MEIGIEAAHCNCTTHCQKGVEPMGDCICRLPGTTITARCEIEGGTTWHNNGSCVSCVRIARQAKKDANQLRHAQILSAPANPVQIEEADYFVPGADLILPGDLAGSHEFKAPAVGVRITPGNSALLEIVLKVNGVELSITKDLAKIQRILQC